MKVVGSRQKMMQTKDYRLCLLHQAERHDRLKELRKRMNKTHIKSSMKIQRFRKLISPWLLALLVLFFSFSSIAASIRSEVDRTEISLNDTLQLTIIVDEQVAFSSPELGDLEKHFDIISRRRSNEYRSNNGEVHSFTKWSLTIGPKQEGKLIVPSFEYDGNYSDAITINVATQKKVSGNRDIFIETELDKKQVFVQEQIIYTQKLYSAVNISSHDPQPLDIAGARVEHLTDHNYQTRISGRPYVVLELRYAIYPQQSGKLEIPALSWVMMTSSGRRNVFDPFGNNQGNVRRMSTETRFIEVQAKPAQSGRWLPTADLKLSQQWSQQPENFVVGEPITRTIQISAQGLTAAQLPLVSTDSENILNRVLKIYPEQPKTEDRKTTGGIQGIRQTTEALIPNTAGPLLLPEISVRWWNTNSNDWQVSKLAAQQVNVKANPGFVPNQNAPVAPAVRDAVALPEHDDKPSASSAQALPEMAEGKLKDVNSGVQPNTLTFWLLGLCFGLICLLLGLSFLYWRLLAKNKDLKEALGLKSDAKANKLNNAQHIETQIQNVLGSVDKANWQSTQQGITELINTLRKEAKISDSKAHLEQLLSQAEELNNIIDDLNTELYSGSSQGGFTINAQEFEQLLRALVFNAEQSKGLVKSQPGALPELYPS